MAQDIGRNSWPAGTIGLLLRPGRRMVGTRPDLLSTDLPSCSPGRGRRDICCVGLCSSAKVLVLESGRGMGDGLGRGSMTPDNTGGSGWLEDRSLLPGRPNR